MNDAQAIAQVRADFQAILALPQAEGRWAAAVAVAAQGVPVESAAILLTHARQPAASQSGSAPIVLDTASTERTRLAAILGSPEAHHRREAARDLAFKTSLSADQAIARMRTMQDNAAEFILDTFQKG